MNRHIEKLIKKREALEAEILAAQQLEKRKTEVLALPAFVQISLLSNKILDEEFRKIAVAHSKK